MKKYWHILVTVFLILGCKVGYVWEQNMFETLSEDYSSLEVEEGSRAYSIFNLRGSELNELIKISQYEDYTTYSIIMSFLEEEIGSAHIRDIIVNNAIDHEIPVLGAVALSWQESRYTPRAINQNTASTDYGLFQLNSLTFPNLSVDQLFDPNINAKEAMKFLKYLLERFDSWDLAVASYNAGPNAIRNKRIPWITFNHVIKISDKIYELEREIGVRLLSSL